MKKILPINTTSDGCAFTVRARYDGACLKSLTGGGADITRTRELLKSMDARILKIRFPKDKRSDGLSIYPWNFLPFAPPARAFSIRTGGRLDSTSSLLRSQRG